jgi:hypothetical protein
MGRSSPDLGTDGAPVRSPPAGVPGASGEGGALCDGEDANPTTAQTNTLEIKRSFTKPSRIELLVHYRIEHRRGCAPLGESIVERFLYRTPSLVTVGSP